LTSFNAAAIWLTSISASISAKLACARHDRHSICDRTQGKPVTTLGRIDRVSTLREVIRERREAIVRQARIGMA
jgi:hypothetical protein